MPPIVTADHPSDASYHPQRVSGRSQTWGEVFLTQRTGAGGRYERGCHARVGWYEFVERQCQSPWAHLWCNGCTGYLSHQFGERQSSEVVLREEFLLKGLVDEVRSRTYQPSTSFW